GGCNCWGEGAQEGGAKTGHRPAHAGSRLRWADVLGRSGLKAQPSSRTGKNPPYGMIGGIEETSASFEARSAPRSYPTNPHRPRLLAGVRRTSFISRCLRSPTERARRGSSLAI